MKKVLLYLSVVLYAYSSFAQDAPESETRKNVVKLNLFGLGATAIPLQYERALSKNMSVALGVTFVPSRSLPAQLDLGSELTNPQFKGIAITPEFRFYPGKKEKHQAPHGFYLAPYLRYASYTFGSPFSFTTSDTVPGTGTTHIT